MGYLILPKSDHSVSLSSSKGLRQATLRASGGDQKLRTGVLAIKHIILGNSDVYELSRCSRFRGPITFTLNLQFVRLLGLKVLIIVRA